MNKQILTLTLALLFAAGGALAQQPAQQRPHQGTERMAPDSTRHHHHHGDHRHHDGPHHHQPRQAAAPQFNADGIDMAIVHAFPTVKSVVKKQKWTEVYDGSKKLLGYAVYSKPASDGIKGYNGETPLLIALSPKQKVMSVELLGNTEGPRFVKSITDAGLFGQWNGLSVKKARKKKVDTVSGATYTSRAIIQSVQAALGQL